MTQEGRILPACNGKEIAGNRDRLVEAVKLASRLGRRVRFLDQQSTSLDWQGRGDVKVNGAFDIGSILAGEDGAGMDGLALRD